MKTGDLGEGFALAHVAQVRIARPTDQLDNVVPFYRDALGFRELSRFKDHAGYDSVMLGLPGRAHHLEFTQRVGGAPCPAPSADNLLVLYVPDRGEFLAVRARLESLGHEAVSP